MVRAVGRRAGILNSGIGEINEKQLFYRSPVLELGRTLSYA
jgi:hypothetical protein